MVDWGRFNESWDSLLSACISLFIAARILPCSENEKAPTDKSGSSIHIALGNKKDDCFNRHRLRAVAPSFQYLVNFMVRVTGLEPHFSATPDWIRTPHILTEPRGVEPLAIINSHARNWWGKVDSNHFRLFLVTQRGFKPRTIIYYYTNNFTKRQHADDIFHER